MNREQRRRASRQRVAAAATHQVANDYQCPDCLPEKRLVQSAPGVFVLAVMHDDTCPAYRAMRGTS